MLASLVYALFAVMGLGFLVFIHELGHYWVARRKGMKVEAFSIGFGKPFFTWERDGVKWHLCWLLFGGYVKIAGMQREGQLEPSEIPNGFYGKNPWDRIQVALAGPVVNIAFALIAFVVLWLSGGRDKAFSEFTQHIGWVDPKSALYERGVRPGDVIEKYDSRSFHGFKDLLIASIMSEKTTEIQGYKVDYLTGEKVPFHYNLDTYQDPSFSKEKLKTIGVLSPARYLIFGADQLPAGSALAASGIQPRDRLLWGDGEILFSAAQLGSLINEQTVLLTVQRGDEVFQTKVPRVQIDDLRMSAYERGEIDDWQHEAGLKGRLQDLYFVPYNFSPSASVEKHLEFIDREDQIKAFDRCERCAYFNPLQEGDQVIAVDGKRIDSSYELLQALQTRKVLLIVQRDPEAIEKINWTQADAQFDRVHAADLAAIVSSIGTDHPIRSSGSLHLLEPVTPTPINELSPSLSEAQRTHLAEELVRMKKQIEAIQDPQQRAEALQQFEKEQRKAVLGVPLVDREVLYNPTPQQQFADVFKETWRTLYGLFSGYLNPKFMSGPVGIIQVVHHSWMIGYKEVLFWMAVISLNLGLINLLPIPVLDGGHILFSVVEIVTKKPIRSKTMERMVIPFIGLLIALFIYITYQDIARLFSKFF